MLKNRWIVRPIDPYDYLAPDDTTHCVQCRATNRIIFYGSLVDCGRVASERNR